MPPPVPWPYLFFIFTSCSSTVVHGASGLSPLTLGGSARPSLSWPFFSLLPLSLPVSLSFPLTLPVSALFHCIILSIHGISYLCLAFAVRLAIVQLQRHSSLNDCVEGDSPLNSGDTARCQDLAPAFTCAPFPLDALGATWRTIQTSTCDHPRLCWVLVCLELDARVYLAKI